MTKKQTIRLVTKVELYPRLDNGPGEDFEFESDEWERKDGMDGVFFSKIDGSKIMFFPWMSIYKTETTSLD